MKRLALILCLLGAPGFAQNVSGLKLADRCQDSADFPDKAYCYGYVSGALAGLLTGAHWMLRVENPAIEESEANNRFHRAVGVCVPDGVTFVQVIKVFRRYVEDNPATGHDPADTLLLMSMREAFPCE